MHPREFIEHHVRQILIEGGHSSDAVQLGCREAMAYYDKTTTFQKGKVFDACLAVAKRMAKLAQKKQQRQPERAVTPSKGFAHG
jgi:hypothetical protein